MNKVNINHEISACLLLFETQAPSCDAHEQNAID